MTYLIYLPVGLLLSAVAGGLTAYLLARDEDQPRSVKALWLLGLSAALLTLIGSLYPILNQAHRLFPASGSYLLLIMTFTCMLSITAVVDAASHYIYDLVLLIFTAICAVFIVLAKLPLQSALIGAAMGGGLYLAIRLLSRWVFKKEAFGMGDVLLMTSIGCVVGARFSLLVALGAFYIALAYVLVVWVLKRGRGLPEYIPFGPFMCLAAWIALHWGEALIALYMRTFLGY